ncbi:MAG: riboflavin synthase [Candidatus Gastranaerophilales bacterium]
MFTGIVEEIGIIKKFSNSVLTIECNKVLENTQLGDSIAINGCCQTVVKITSNSFDANLSEETIRLTKEFRVGTPVNLERALTPSTRMGGHIVQGHVDQIAKYLGDMRFQVEDSKYLVYKGSITIDGVSLTISAIDDDIFEIAVIPHTLDNTTLKSLKAGDFVNIETDILGRYIEKFLTTTNNSSITENFLIENGFY